MRLPMRIVSICTAAALLAQSLLVMAAAPSPAYAVTIGEAQAVAGRVGAGTFHSLAVNSGNTLFAWGDNAEGQTVLSGMTDVTKVAAGADYSLALKSDGTVVASGLDSYGQCQVPPGLAGVIAVAAGWRHSLALKSDGTVAAWGGGGTESSIAVPSGLTDAVAISAGWRHSIALRSDGTSVAWGLNESGQCLGPVSIDPVPNSSEVPTDSVFRILYNTQVLAGSTYTQIRLEDGLGSPVPATSTLDGSLVTACTRLVAAAVSAAPFHAVWWSFCSCT